MARCQVLLGLTLILAMAQKGAGAMSVEKSSFVICKEPGRYVGWPTIARTADGELLVVFSGDREGHVCPFGKTQLVRSNDGGKTWDYPNEILIRDDAPNGDLGYPASLQMDDETILTIYYQIDRPGEKTCLMGTLWKLPKN